MDTNKIGVHRTHCCIIHGCKYGDEDCPVVSGEVKQDYKCEECDFYGVDPTDEISMKFYSYRACIEDMWDSGLFPPEQFIKHMRKLLDKMEKELT